MDSLDKKLEEIYTADIELPEWYKYTVRNTLKECKQNLTLHYRKTFKPLIAFASCLLLITTVTFAYNNKEISENIKNFFKVNKGMDTAIENGYIEKPEMEYINSNDVSVKVDNFLMDDFNLCFTFNIKFDNSIDISNMDKINLNNFIITDECKRIIYCDNKNIFNEYVSEENLDYQYNEFNENYINNGVNYYVKNQDLEENTISLVYNLYTDTNYPKSKNLNFKFSNINYIDNNTNKNISLVGDWNLDIAVPEEFYNRTGIIYRVKSCSDERINVEKAVVYDTCMKFSFTMKTNKIYNENDSKEEIERKVKEREKSLKEQDKQFANSDGSVSIPIEEWEEYELTFAPFSTNTFIETEYGTKYFPTRSNPGDEEWDDGSYTGIIKYRQTYALTKYDVTNNLKIYLKFNNNGEWEDIIVELEK